MGVFTDSSVAPSPRASDDLSEPLFQDTHLKSAKSKLPWSWCYIFPWFLSVALFILLAVEKAKKLSKEPIFWKEYEFGTLLYHYFPLSILIFVISQPINLQRVQSEKSHPHGKRSNSQVG